jgi:hypothetical protein
MTFVDLDGDLDWEFVFDSHLGHPTGSSEEPMAKKSKRRCEELPILHPDAAGIDVGASELFVAVSADRAALGSNAPVQYGLMVRKSLA